ncbi:hypothetical protein B0H10DRAFT_1353657 [Mycena sp. CBHHK59/15]|nr:hypothetical protein B0H10DRAFT_1353657 [Mycena sp. CBHHK59/15]
MFAFKARSTASESASSLRESLLYYLYSREELAVSVPEVPRQRHPATPALVQLWSSRSLRSLHRLHCVQPKWRPWETQLNPSPVHKLASTRPSSEFMQVWSRKRRGWRVQHSSEILSSGLKCNLPIKENECTFCGFRGVLDVVVGEMDHAVLLHASRRAATVACLSSSQVRLCTLALRSVLDSAITLSSAIGNRDCHHHCKFTQVSCFNQAKCRGRALVLYKSALHSMGKI